MSTIQQASPKQIKPFNTVLQPFLQQEGLPFAEILSAESIEQAFSDRYGLFAQRDEQVYSTAVVLWAFLAQTLRDGKGASCGAAVADIATYANQIGGSSPCGDTGDYCRARAKLNLPALRELVTMTADGLQSQVDPDWLWLGRHVKLVDGFDFTMADTPENQRIFPQQPVQKQGLGFPIARACAVLSLATAAVHGVAVGPYLGKQTGESALLRDLLDLFQPGEVALFDRSFCSYMMLALLQMRGIDVCGRLHHCRKVDYDQAEQLSPGDYRVTWERPERPEWMSEDLYAQIPQTMTVRLVEFEVTDENKRVESMSVVTTLLDPRAYSKEAIGGLFECRWNVELDICAIKSGLNLDFVACKSPEMVRRHVQVTLLAYNLIRKVAAAAAKESHKHPRQMSFTRTCQEVLSSWMLLSTGDARHPRRMWEDTLRRIAAHPVADRPGRVEPRAVKRRPRPYSLLMQPRAQARKKARKSKGKGKAKSKS